MAYTKTCERCPAKITWDDTNKRYVDEIFTDQKHDHDRYKAAKAYAEEQSHESFNPPPQEKEQESKGGEGSECFVCKKSGFPGELIFFSDDMKGSKTGKHIPLQRPDKVNGEYITHEHKGQQKGKFQDTSTPKPVEGKDVNDTIKVAEPVEGAGFDQYNLADALKAFTNQLNSQQQWFEDSRDKIDTILAYVLDHTVKKANE